jgi:hypothetical protein
MLTIGEIPDRALLNDETKAAAGLGLDAANLSQELIGQEPSAIWLNALVERGDKRQQADGIAEEEQVKPHRPQILTARRFVIFNNRQAELVRFALKFSEHRYSWLSWRQNQR